MIIYAVLHEVLTVINTFCVITPAGPGHYRYLSGNMGTKLHEENTERCRSDVLVHVQFFISFQSTFLHEKSKKGLYDSRMSTSMGLDCSKPNEISQHSRSALSFCSSPYRPFHPDGKPIPPPFTMLKQLKHSGPLGLNQVMKVTASAFPPNDDTCLLTLTTFAGHSFRNFRAGFVQCWDFEHTEETHEDSLFTYSPRPVCCFSPNGEVVSYILNTGNGHIILAERTSDCSLEPLKIDCDTSGYGDRSLLSRALCCVFSPDGLKAVTVSNVTLESHRGTETNEICLWQVKSKKKLKSCWRVSCEVVLPRFAGHMVSCVFSPDSSFLAFSSSLSQLYVLKSENLDLLSAIRTDIVPGNACSCAFDPCYPCQKLAACFEDGLFQVWFIDGGQTNCIKEMHLVQNPARLTSFCYSPDGSFLAIGTSQGKVLLIETELFCTLHELDVDKNTDIDICSVAFTMSCQELAAGQSDGVVRIWQLPLKLELQHMCRLMINKLVAPNQVDDLPLPRNLKAYLLYSPLTVHDNIEMDDYSQM